MIVYEPVTDNDGDDEDEQRDGIQSVSSEWEVSDFGTSNDSGSDSDWAP